MFLNCIIYYLGDYIYIDPELYLGDWYASMVRIRIDSEDLMKRYIYLNILPF